MINLIILGTKYTGDYIIDFYTRHLIGKTKDSSLFYIIDCSLLLVLILILCLIFKY